MSFNMNPPQWEPKINRPQAASNNGRGSGGGGGYAGAQGGEDQQNKKVPEVDIFRDEIPEFETDADSSLINLFKLAFEKLKEFFRKKQN